MPIDAAVWAGRKLHLNTRLLGVVRNALHDDREEAVRLFQLEQVAGIDRIMELTTTQIFNISQFRLLYGASSADALTQAVEEADRASRRVSFESGLVDEEFLQLPAWRRELRVLGLEHWMLAQAACLEDPIVARPEFELPSIEVVHRLRRMSTLGIEHLARWEGLFTVQETSAFGILVALSLKKAPMEQLQVVGHCLQTMERDLGQNSNPWGRHS